MSLYTRPDSPWWWYVIEGTTLRKSTGVPKDGGSPQQNKELRRQALDIYVAAKAKHAQQVAGLVSVKPTIRFRDFAIWYDTHVITHYRSANRSRSMLTRLVQTFGDCDLSAISVSSVREWMSDRRAAGVQPATVNRELDVLKAMLRAAVPKYLDHSPLGDVRRYRVPETDRRILTGDEETRLLAVANAEERALLIVALDTLLRLSSVVLLKWPQVKLEQGIIIPLNAKVSQDYVPITERMHAALTALPHDGDYVFASLHRHLRGGDSAAKNKAIRLFDRLCAAAGVKHGRAVDGVTFHCLRHTGASRALQRGASVRTVMKLGGWKDLRSVLRYTHASDLDVRQAAESIGRFTFPARTPKTKRKRA